MCHRNDSLTCHWDKRSWNVQKKGKINVKTYIKDSLKYVIVNNWSRIFGSKLFTDTKRAGILELDAKNRVVAFLEKPHSSETSSRWAVSRNCLRLQAIVNYHWNVTPYCYFSFSALVFTFSQDTLCNLFLNFSKWKMYSNTWIIRAFLTCKVNNNVLEMCANFL